MNDEDLAVREAVILSIEKEVLNELVYEDMLRLAQLYSNMID